MADYRELLRKAIDALPENTGANRRSVYEKARGALVAQLRAIEPPLPAREITQHRLALEDCIRQVEQEATDKLLGRFKDVEEPQGAPAEPDFEPELPDDTPDTGFVDDDLMPVGPDTREPEIVPVAAAPRPAAPSIRPSTIAPAPATGSRDGYVPYAAGVAVAPATPGGPPGSIEDIIAAAEASRDGDVPQRTNGHDTHHDDHAPAVEAFSDADVELAPEPAPGLILPSSVAPPPAETGRRGGLFGFGRNKATPAAPAEPAPGLLDVRGNPISARSVDPVGEAMSSEREVDVEPVAPPPVAEPEPADPQGAIDRAIAVLDREARGEITPSSPDEDIETPPPAPAKPSRKKAEPRYAEEDPEERGGVGALTVFLVIAVLLLAGGGAAGFWAWREGYVDLDTLFAQGQPTTTTEVAEVPDGTDAPVTTETPATVPDAVSEEPVDPAGAVTGEAMPGEALPFVEPQPESPAGATEDRLPSETDTPLPAAPEGEDPVADVAAVAAGPQSLLLEEQPNGAAGAVPYSGSVTWSRGSDELGNPTIEATATIPARNLSLDLLLRRNADTTLPASHLMEINFTVSETFVGGTVASLPGILLKNDELVQGQPLTGASARIVGNSFLFALSSASPRDVETNIDLLEGQGWLDVAMVYGTGRRAILTLEKGEAGEELFAEVLAAWAALDAGGEAEPADGDAPADADAADDAPAEDAAPA